MGGASSRTHDELIEYLVNEEHITTASIEQIFRAVDRGHYHPRGAVDQCYADGAWIFGSLHQSSPSIYTQVIENLDLQKGMSFLNLGSGTGYLSTLAGLILGRNGINHGIEFYEDVVEYAKDRVASFICESDALDKFDFCCPEFVVGNFLQLPATVQYDRVYCGANSLGHECIIFLKRFIKVNGILITPVKSDLMLYKRVEENKWESRSLLPVTFSSLLPASNPFLKQPILPQAKILSLEELCILSVRDILRKTVYAENEQFGLDSTLVAANERLRNKRKASDIDSDCEVNVWQDGKVNTLKMKSNGVDTETYKRLAYALPLRELCSSDSESDSDSSDKSYQAPLVENPSKFSELFVKKIQLLQLPKLLLVKLNRGRRL